jgi:AcrR family transcriptional regulator
MSTATVPAEPEISARQAEVLDAVLRQLVTDGNGLTMTAVARQASCSKETLYKWFGDRDGLLNATVKYQAARVHVAAIGPDPLDRSALQARLEEFATNWLLVISSETSLALNRVAIGQAGADQSLGAIVLANGRFALGNRMKPVLDAGRKAGLLVFADAEEAFRTLFGLVARDVQIRLLLGDALALDAQTARADAVRAVTQFFALYGAQPRGGQAAP